MKIIKEEQNLMIIKDRNIFAFFVGVIFTLAGFLVILKPDFFTNQPPFWSRFAGIAIGLLASLADALGTLVGGTALLLGIMITFQFYQNIAQQHAMDMNPALKKMMGV